MNKKETAKERGQTSLEEPEKGEVITKFESLHLKVKTER